MSSLISLNFGVKHQMSRLRILRGMKFVRQARLKVIPLLPSPASACLQCGRSFLGDVCPDCSQALGLDIEKSLGGTSHD